MPAIIRRLPIDGWRGGFTSLLLPVPGASFFHWLGGSFDTSVINGADPDFPSIIIGSPDLHDTYMGLKGRTNFIQTQAFDDVSGTYFVIARSIDLNDANATRPMLIGTEGDEGTNIHVQSATSTRIMVSTDIDGVMTAHNTPVLVDNTSLFKCYIGSFDQTERRILSMTDNRSSGTQTHTGERRLGEAPICVGGGLESRWSGRCEVAAAGFWPRRLTPIERRDLYLYAKRIANDRGLPV